MSSISEIMRIIGKVYAEMDRKNFSLIAAGIGLFGMIALFPALAAIVMLWSLVADPADASALVALGAGALPPDVQTVLSDQIARVIAAGSDQGFGWALLFTLAFSIWSARAGVAALIRGLNAVHDTQPRTSWFGETVAALLLTIVLSGLALVQIAAMVVAPILMKLIPLGTGTEIAVDVARWLLTAAVAVFALGTVYRYGPNFPDPRPAWITPGAVVSVALLLLMSVALSAYLARFGNYNKVYGSIGAAVALLIWFYLSSLVVLLGGALNAELARRGLLRFT